MAKRKPNWESIVRQAVRQKWGDVTEAQMRDILDRLPAILEEYPDGPPEEIIERIDKEAQEIFGKK